MNEYNTGKQYLFLVHLTTMLIAEDSIGREIQMIINGI
jgi:hypothetical protein